VIADTLSGVAPLGTDEDEKFCRSDYSRCLYQILSTRPLFWTRSGFQTL
jgi:hypothetical protein